MQITKDEVTGLINSIKSILIHHSMVAVDYLNPDDLPDYQHTITDFISHNLELLQEHLLKESNENY